MLQVPLQSVSHQKWLAVVLFLLLKVKQNMVLSNYRNLNWINKLNKISGMIHELQSCNSENHTTLRMITKQWIKMREKNTKRNIMCKPYHYTGWKGTKKDAEITTWSWYIEKNIWSLVLIRELSLKIFCLVLQRERLLKKLVWYL